MNESDQPYLHTYTAKFSLDIACHTCMPGPYSDTYMSSMCWDHNQIHNALDTTFKLVVFWVVINISALYTYTVISVRNSTDLYYTFSDTLYICWLKTFKGSFFGINLSNHLNFHHFFIKFWIFQWNYITASWTIGTIA